MLPHNQPYDANSSARWYYERNETVDPIPGFDIVDWILVELRDATDANSALSGTMIAQQPAFLLNDGSCVDLNGSSILSFYHSIIQSLFVVVWHRNHLGIMSATPLTETEGIYNYDFTTSAGQAYNSGQKEIVTGVWGMIAGDADGTSQVNEMDITGKWSADAGKCGYFSGDMNLDSQLNNQDKNDVWLPNNGQGNQVPD
ncbi:MAG: hypothetical protein K8S16_08135 [Bacteroidales bacterium]|nr:hypothetical protein [Bacteroidales bacterium]